MTAALLSFFFVSKSFIHHYYKRDEIKQTTRSLEGWPPNVLVESLSRTHGALDVQRPDVLPVLLEKGDEEVDGQVDVLDQLLLAHADVADSHAQAQDLSDNGKH